MFLIVGQNDRGTGEQEEWIWTENEANRLLCGLIFSNISSGMAFMRETLSHSL